MIANMDMRRMVKENVFYVKQEHILIGQQMISVFHVQQAVFVQQLDVQDVRNVLRGRIQQMERPVNNVIHHVKPVIMRMESV